MTLGHSHTWLEVRRSYSPPLWGSKWQGNLTVEFSKMIAFGITSIELRCADCGDIKVTEAVGDLTKKGNNG